MRIEEVIIEGFKSYPVRTVITGWDPSFNAITGLNGSGKSNILDAICFVLGITNLSQMRCQNLQDLIYKRGQAGITKASVSIVFDNSDPATSPAGKTHQKQITFMRQVIFPNKSKYMVDGHNSTLQQMQTLFQSVQLNINNPNFVLNMKAKDILGMVEEAAGTRMFEERKDKAKKTMDKKEKRMQEIRDTISQDIVPSLEKLRQEKRTFVQYQKVTTELELNLRLLRAHEYVEWGRRAEAKEAEIEAARATIKEQEAEKKAVGKELAGAEKHAAEVTRRRDAEKSKTGKLKKLNDEVTELGKVLTKEKTQMDIKNESIKAEEKKIVSLETKQAESESGINKRRKEVEKVKATYDGLKKKHDELEAKLASDEELLQTLLTGLSSKGAKNRGGYLGQLAAARERITQAVGEQEQCKVKLAMGEREKADLEARVQAQAKEAAASRKMLENLRATVKGLEEALAGTGWSAEKDQQLHNQLRQARDEVKRLSEERDRLRASIPRLNFQYEQPPNFNRSNVKGVAASLISLSEEHYDKAGALEVAGGGKLWNVVVTDETVSKELIKNGGMRKRVTFIPLSKISAYTLPPRKLESANRLAPGKVRTALSLVGYQKDVSKAIEFVFGDTLICDDAAAAREVTFNETVKVRSVTLDGDTYDPSGTLSGGAKADASDVLVRIQRVVEIEQTLAAAHERLQKLVQEEGRTRGVRERWQQLGQDLDLKQHELTLLEAQVGGSTASLDANAVEKVKSTIADLKLALQEARDKQTAAQAECEKLERDMDEFKNNKDGKIEELKASITAQKAALQKHAVLVKTQQKELQAVTLELEQVEGDIAGEKQEIEDAKQGIVDLRKELAKLTTKCNATQAEFIKAEDKLREETATLSRFDEELKDLDIQIKQAKSAISKADLVIQDQNHVISGLQKEVTTAVNQQNRMETSYNWIPQDKDQFGKPGTKYDFEGHDFADLKQKCAEQAQLQEGMKKKINNKVMNMIDTVEKKEADLKKNMAIVEKDKEKIEKTVADLDGYKRDALMKTWEKVNTDFGGIFAELLPGNHAKLVPPEGQDLMDGLEVKVRLGTVWKQSLTELSGGQRSLIALSLIMALLQFKPAPMYILDEIDAALDLSHTQHIGQLFRTRFKGSQFIVVSLKEGLFTNANVLFRARFRDGTSIVERTQNRSASALYANGNGDDENEGRNQRQRARVTSS
ncbi:hypothetical protein D9619_008670 [Psilocybe cf. subviscida]|uniref:Structural maintenance of chromosomes protein n=1 Tax=Psilocybe cf. subviscida TaxID=2480587 RepID=A0A8H5F0P8_9AGAR|nr:hypothetical protein D9619_008670 [Psilocybe cf. subviscida]